MHQTYIDYVDYLFQQGFMMQHIPTTKQSNDNFKLLHVMVLSRTFGEETTDCTKTGHTSLDSVIEGYHAVVEGGDAIISPELWQNSFSTSRCFAVFWKIWFQGEVYKYKL